MSSSCVWSSAHHFFRVKCYLSVLMGKFGNSLIASIKMESDHSLSVLILILFLFSEKLVGGAIFKCYQVSLTHFLSDVFKNFLAFILWSFARWFSNTLLASFVPLDFSTLSVE